MTECKFCVGLEENSLPKRFIVKPSCIGCHQTTTRGLSKENSLWRMQAVQTYPDERCIK